MLCKYTVNQVLLRLEIKLMKGHKVVAVQVDRYFTISLVWMLVW